MPNDMADNQVITGARKEKRIAFTFDDGPHISNTPALLNLAEASGVKMTFFVVGNRVEKHSDIIQRQICEGHEVGNHSWSHSDLTKLDYAAAASELRKTQDVLVKHAAVEPRVFRPPYGLITDAQREWIARDFNCETVLWNVDSADWRAIDAMEVAERVLRRIRPGAIVLFHDLHDLTIKVMPPLCESLLSTGFQFVTVSELRSK